MLSHLAGFLSLRKEEPLPELFPQTPVPSYSWPRSTQVADKIVSPSCVRSSLPPCPFSWCPLCHSFNPPVVVETSRQHTTTLIGEYTDLLVLLLYYAQGEVMNLYFRSDKPKADGSIEVYHINRIQEVLWHEMFSQLMFIHAMTGSDTTSRIFGVGKKTAFQYLAKGDPVLRSCAIAFTIPNQTTELIDNLGCQAMHGCPLLWQGHRFTCDNAV